MKDVLFYLKVIRRNVKDVRKLASHPTLPYCKCLDSIDF